MCNASGTEAEELSWAGSKNSAANLSRRGRDHRFIRITGTPFAVGCLYPINIGLIPGSRVVNVGGSIGANGAYLSPSAGTRGVRFLVHWSDANLIAALDDEVAFVVRVVDPGKTNGISLRVTRRRRGRSAPVSAEPQVSIRLPSPALCALQVGAELLDSSAMALHAITARMEHCSEDWKFEGAATAPGGLLCG
jgi:hypothetical protein